MSANRTVSKQVAASAQLDTAIKLFFENRDLISAYTLASAADGILEGIYQNKRSEIINRQDWNFGDRRQGRFSWNEEWEIRLKPEYKKPGFRLLNAVQNFFKHADKDNDAALDFNEWEETSWRIFRAILNYHLVYLEVSPAMNVFFNVFAALHPNLLTEDNPLRELIENNPLCENLSERFSQAEISAIGFEKLERDCPDLFRDTSIVGNLRPASSKLTLRVPTSKE